MWEVYKSIATVIMVGSTPTVSPIRMVCMDNASL